MKKMVFLGLCLALSLPSFAGQPINNLLVTYVATGWVSEGYYVNTTYTGTSSDGCGPALMIEPGNPMVKPMLAMLMSAFHTGAKVNLYVDGCVNSGVMRLKAVALAK